MRLTKGNATMPPLTDLDFFLLGAVTKLFATSVTYPCEWRSLVRQAAFKFAPVAPLEVAPSPLPAENGAEQAAQCDCP